MYLFFYIDYLNGPGMKDYSAEVGFDKKDGIFLDDIKTSNQIFKKKLGYVPTLFSYPFGEYSKFMRDHISKNFKIAFGQHSGIIDINKNKFELPRFPINENYGEIKRFKSIINYYPLEYKNLEPIEKKLSKEIYDSIKNLKTNELSKPIYLKETILIIKKMGEKILEKNIEKIKTRIVQMEKEKKLEMFSNSHFSNLERTTQIDFL